MRSRWYAIAPLLLAALFHTGRASAADPPDGEVEARLAYLERALAREQGPMVTWRDGWVAAYAGFVLAQGGFALSATDGAARATAIIGAAKSTIGLVAILATPATARTAATRLEAVSARTPRERREKLRLAESLLRESAREQRFRRGWFPLVGAALVNTAGAWALWAAHRVPVTGWLGIGVGLSVGQIQYWTQPTGAAPAWDAYTRGLFRRAPARAGAAGGSLSVAPSPGGLALAGSF